MITPGVEPVRARLGPGPVLRPIDHWIPGRRGLTYLVEGLAGGQRSVFKWCLPAELACWRNLLPAAPVATPRLYRWWDAAPGTPAAVELEHLPELATPALCYRFSPEHLALTAPAWRGACLDDVFAQLGRAHAADLRGQGLGAPDARLTRADRASDLAAWEEVDAAVREAICVLTASGSAAVRSAAAAARRHQRASGDA